MKLQLQEILHKISTCKSVQDYADLSMELIGNPMLIFDFNMRVLASTDIEVDDVNYSYMREQRFPMPNLTKDKAWRAMIKDIWKQEDVNINMHEGKLFLSKVLRINEVVVGQINAIGYNRPFTEDDIAIVEVISYPLAALLYETLGLNLVKTSEFEYCLEYLLDGNRLNRETMQLRMDLAEWKPDQYMYVICASSFEHGGEYQKQEFQRILKGNDIMLRYWAYIVLIISNKKELAATDYEWLRKELKAQNVVCGISLVMEDILNLKRAFEEAKAALEIGKRVEPEPFALYNYEDYMEYGPFYALGSDVNLESYIFPKMRQLATLDQAKNMELLKTFRIYLYSGRSIHKTSQVLHIHRNTVSYRIGKVFDYLEMEMDNGKHLQKIAESIRLMEYVDQNRYFK